MKLSNSKRNSMYIKESTAVLAALWGCTQAQQCFKLNMNITKQQAHNDSANMLMFSRNV